MKTTRTNPTTEALSGIFALSALALLVLVGILAAIAIIAVLPFAVLALCGYGLCWAIWQQVTEGRTQQSRKAGADLARTIVAEASWIIRAITPSAPCPVNALLDWFERPTLELALAGCDDGPAVHHFEVEADDYMHPASVFYPAAVEAGQDALPEIVPQPRIDADDVLDMRLARPTTAQVLGIDTFPAAAFQVETLPIIAVLPIQALIATADAETGPVDMGGLPYFDDQAAEESARDFVDVHSPIVPDVAPEPKPEPMPSAAQATESPMDVALRFVAQGKAVKAAAREAGVPESTLRGRLKKQRKEMAA